MNKNCAIDLHTDDSYWLFIDMGLTKERKIFLGLAAVAGVALIADQGIFATQDASAQAIDVFESTPVEESVVELKESSISLPAAKILIDRLQENPPGDSTDSLGAIFSLSKLMVTQETDQENAGSDSSDLNESSASKASFALIPPQAKNLPVLSAVMPSKNGTGGAVMDGEILRVGQVNADGYRLVEVKQRTVIVELNGVQYAVEIPRISDE